jgi:hypothetical protein
MQTAQHMVLLLSIIYYLLSIIYYLLLSIIAIIIKKEHMASQSSQF